MKNVKITRRSFLLGLGAASSALLLSACGSTDAPASSASTSALPQPDSGAPASSAASEVPLEPILRVDEFPITDGSTACIPLIAQIMADTTGLDLETARSAVTTNTTAQAWRNLGLYGNNYGDSVKLIIAYEAPESVKEELKADGDPLEQKAIGRDALVFIVRAEPDPAAAQGHLRRNDHQLERCGRQGSGDHCIPAAGGLRQPDPVPEAIDPGGPADGGPHRAGPHRHG